MKSILFEGLSKYVESFLKEDSTLTEAKKDLENFRNWVKQKVTDLGFPDNANGEAYVDSWVNWFEKNRGRLKSPENDYYYWIKKNNWGEFTKLVDDTNKKINAQQSSKEGAKLLYDKDGWKVYEITTYEASVKYGKNTKWCISGSKRWSGNGDGTRFWNDYAQQNVKFYFFINTKDNHKYALALYPDEDTFEIFNDEDIPIVYIPNAPFVKEIGVDYMGSPNGDFNKFANLFINNGLPNNDSVEYLNRWIEYNLDEGFNTIIIPKEGENIVEEYDLIPREFLEYYFKEGEYGAPQSLRIGFAEMSLNGPSYDMRVYNNDVKDLSESQIKDKIKNFIRDKYGYGVTDFSYKMDDVFGFYVYDIEYDTDDVEYGAYGWTGDYPTIDNWDDFVDTTKVHSSEQFIEETNKALCKYAFLMILSDWGGGIIKGVDRFSEVLISLWQQSSDESFNKFLNDEVIPDCLSYLREDIDDGKSIQPYLDLGFNEEFLTGGKE